jgi:hypothetical protein
MSLTPEQLQAIKVLANDKSIKESREDIEAGVHMVDFTLRVTGAVKVGEDTESAPSVKLDDKAIIAMLLAELRDLGSTTTVTQAASALRTIASAGKKKMVASTDYAEALVIEKEVALREKGKSKRRGSVTGSVKFVKFELCDIAHVPASPRQMDPLDLLS